MINLLTLEIKALLICGGVNFYQITTFTSNECFILDNYSSKLFATMSEKRAFAASLITNDNNLWITGGLNYDTDEHVSSTEYILKNGESVKGPELPLAVSDHTVIGINSTFSMVIGGTLDIRNGIDFTFYYDHYNQVWYDGPYLNIRRSTHGTGKVTDLITREKLVVVTGGKYCDDDSCQIFDSTEILIDGNWVLGNKKAKLFTQINLQTCNFHLG